MHHTLKLYSANRRFVLRLYMLGAACTRLPLVGRLAQKIADSYGRKQHQAYLLTPEEADALLEIAGGVAVGPCDCRRTFHHCDNPVEVEILLGPTRHIFMESMPQNSREITRQEARDIMGDCRRRGLIPTVIRCRGDYYAICHCCRCCCVPLRFSKDYGIGGALVRHQDIVGEFREYQATHRDDKY